MERSLTPTPQRWEIYTLLTLVVLGFLIRVMLLGTVHYNIDEAMLSILASKIALGKDLPLEGLRTSFGFTNPPTLIYLNALWFRLSANPLLAQTALVILNTLAIPLMWLSGRRAAGVYMGIIAALLITISPNAIEYSRRLWGHDWMVLLSSICAYCLIRAWQDKSWLFTGLAGGAVLLAQSIHLSAITLWPAVLYAAYRTKSDWLKILLIWAGVFFLVYTPWIVAEFKGNFQNMRILLDVLIGGGASKDLGNILHPAISWILVMGDFAKNDLLGAVPLSEVSRPLSVSRMVLIFFSIDILIVVAVYIAGCIDKPISEKWLLALPPLASLLLFGILITASVPYYHLPTLPFFVLLLAAALSSLLKTQKKFVLGALVVYTAFSLYHTIQMRLYLANGGASSAPFSEKWEVMKTIRDEVDDRPFTIYQDGRPSGSGTDIAWPYLAYAVGIDEKQWTGIEEAEVGFLIRKEETILREPVESSLKNMKLHEQWNHVGVYRLSRDELLRWERLTSEFPPPQQ